MCITTQCVRVCVCVEVAIQAAEWWTAAAQNAPSAATASSYSSVMCCNWRALRRSRSAHLSPFDVCPVRMWFRCGILLFIHILVGSVKAENLILNLSLKSDQVLSFKFKFKVSSEKVSPGQDARYRIT